MVMADSGQSGDDEGILTRALHMAVQVENNQRFVPRNARPAFGIDEVREIGNFLRNEKPPSPEAAQSREDTSSKRSSGISRRESRHTKPSLEFLRRGRFPSRHFRSLLRSHSASPPPVPRSQNVENTYVVEKISLIRQQIPGGQQEYTRILRDSSKTDSLDNISTYRINYAADRPPPATAGGLTSNPVATQHTNPRKEQPRKDHIANAANQGHPVPYISQDQTESCNGLGSEMSRKALPKPADSSTRNFHTLPRQGTAPQIRDFAEKGPQFPDPELIATIERRKRRSAKARAFDESCETGKFGLTRDEVGMIKSEGDNKTLRAAEDLVYSQTSRSKDMQNVARALFTLSTETRFADQPSTGRHSKESTTQSASTSENADAATDITTPSLAVSASEISKHRRTASPKPAPTGPLPPLPEGAATSIKLNGSMLRRKSPSREQPQLPASAFSIVPPKSPARSREPLAVASTNRPSQKTHSTLGSDLKWPYPPATQSVSKPTPEVTGKPMVQASSLEDPFVFRAQRTKDLKRRDRQHCKSITSNGAANRIQDDDMTRPRGEIDTNAVVSMDKARTEVLVLNDKETEGTLEGESVEEKTQFEKAAKPLSRSQIQTIVDTQPTEPAEKALYAPPRSSTMRITYRSHSTQYSPGRRGSGTSEAIQQPCSRGPSLIVTEPSIDGIQDWDDETSAADMPQSGCPSDSYSRSSRSSRQNTQRASTPENSVDINDLEARMEARLANFEQKTMLLEAALLGVINASARTNVGGARNSRSTGSSRNASSMIWETGLDGPMTNNSLRETRDH